MNSHLRQNKEVRSKDSWVWLQKGELKRENLTLATQDQWVRTKLIKTTIDKSQNDPLYRLCKSPSESIYHIVSGCRKLAQKDYKRVHDNMGRIVHWDIGRKCDFKFGENQYEH